MNDLLGGHIRADNVELGVEVVEAAKLTGSVVASTFIC